MFLNVFMWGAFLVAGFFVFYMFIRRVKKQMSKYSKIIVGCIINDSNDDESLKYESNKYSSLFDLIAFNVVMYDKG